MKIFGINLIEEGSVSIANIYIRKYISAMVFSLKKVPVNAKLFYVAWTLLLISKTSGIGGADNPLVILLYCLSSLFLIVKLVRTKYSSKELLFIAVIAFISLIIFFFSGFYEFFIINVLLVIAAKNININKLVKYTFFLRLFMFIGVVLLNSLSIIPSYDKFLFHGNVNTGVVRYSLGFFHPNALSFQSFVLVSLFLFTYFKRARVISTICSIVFVFAIYFLAKGRTFLLVSTLEIIMMWIASSRFFNRKRARIILLISSLIPFACILLCFLYSDDNYLMNLINNFLSGRIGLGNDFINHYGVSLLGTYTTNFYVEEVLKVLDPSYMVILLRCGIIGFLMMYSLILIILILFYREKKYIHLIIFMFFLIYGLSEEAPSFVAYNVLILYFSEIFPKKIKRKGYINGKRKFEN
ncbi:hypothetical protein B5F14_09805 [Faecalitalea cylindroides]|uniref:Polysaccharide polymerase n=1 Tax=Faecalitalea cylindroides TaxID=39483 RepID=A0A1Y4LHZ5_9FIRM|nr:oligosaccharide repeat unit polymerase [Faecalitalea cylindroides]OUP56318.1 hypothetical protein B5F14_09805 [Faecalitalea cylindroides]